MIPDELEYCDLCEKSELADILDGSSEDLILMSMTAEGLSVCPACAALQKLEGER